MKKRKDLVQTGKRRSSGKRLLSFVLTICMALAMMPGTAFAVLDKDAIIGTTEYDTLQEAVNAVSEGDTIRLLRNISLAGTVTIADTNNKSFTIDLNGRTLHSGNMTALVHNGSGTLTIRDSASGGGGKVTGTKRDYQSGMIYLNGGSLVVESGTVENTGMIGNENAIYVSSGSMTVKGGVVKSVSDASYSIYNAGSGSVMVTGGTVQNDNGPNSHAIRSGGTGSVIVSGGTVMGAKGFAIGQISTGDVIVSGGIVNGKRIAISNTADTGKITISGTPTICSDSYEDTIRVSGILEITGGTVENINVSGTAINANKEATTISIPSGSAIIRGGSKAMAKAPDLSGYTNVRVTASTDYSGTSAEGEYRAGNITSYKYFKFEPAYTISGTIMGSDTSSGISGATVQLKDGTGTIATITTNSSGDYTFSGIPAGTYSIAVSAGGYNSGTKSVVISDSNVTGQNLTLTVYTAPPSGGGGGGGSKTATLVTKFESGENITSANVDKLVKEGKNLTVEGKDGEKLIFDTEALKNINGQTKDSVKVDIKDVSADHKNEHPGRLVVSLTVTAGGKHISSFGSGTATVSLPYELKTGETADEVTVWYLAEDGTMSEVPCSYDPVTKLATFKVNHFSLYVVGTADKTSWTNPFSDVKESSWFYDVVRYVSSNGMMQGTTDTAFNPNGKTTRGMIVTILWRMEKEPKVEKEIAFTDVKTGKYYHDAVAWASEKGIVGGYSAERFGPEDNITREQLAVILHNYAASKGYKKSVSGEISVFGDSGKIHSWSKDAVSWANAEGLINGKGDNLLDPLGAAERCQVAAILQRFMENVAK